MYSPQVLYHSSIKFTGDKIIYFDPFKIDGCPNDADIIFITHDHYDHFSEEDIQKTVRSDTAIVVPVCLKKKALQYAKKENVFTVSPGDLLEISGIQTEVVAAYNVIKPFHPKSKKYVGYIISLDGERYYIAGDTDRNPDNENVKCDVALVPIGGTYTMDAVRAAEFVNHIKPKKVIPTHYGSIVGSMRDAETFSETVDKDIEVEIQLK